MDVILKTVTKYRAISVSFYGAIEPDYKEKFLMTIKTLSNVEYKGIFQGTDDERYDVLSEYDILLLPTRWEAEGMPGIIIEGRIAGLVPVVSNHNYNWEMVNDGVDGVILNNKSDPDELADSILRLSVNRKIFDFLRCNSIKRSEYYYIENNIDEIVKKLI